MLIEFKVKNFRSFRDEQTLNMVAAKKDVSHQNNLIPIDDFSVAKAAAIYGANASGKSNLIKAMGVMEQLVVSSATKMNLGDRIQDISPFRLDQSTVNEPSRFELTVLIDDVTYNYGFSATTQRVHDEWLFVRQPGKHLSKWLERYYDPTTDKTDWHLRGPLKKDAELLQSKTRDNGLLLSRGAELNITALQSLFLWFRKKFWVLDFSKVPIDMLTQYTAEYISKDNAYRLKVLKLLQDADLGISNINASEKMSADKISDTMPKELRELLSRLAEEIKSKKYQITTSHRVDGTEEEINFNLEDDESNGTQRLFALAFPILDCLENGEVLLIDELDCSMHPLLSRKLVALFQSKIMNQKGAQLIFTTHDSSLMDSSLFRRDQIWLTEKLQSGSTDLFSLYDIKKPRKKEALEKNYLEGRYGAIPNFGIFYEGLEVE